MLTALFGKRKIAEEKLANAFIHALFEFTEQGFPLICAEINESPEFITPPEVDPSNDGYQKGSQANQPTSSKPVEPLGFPKAAS